MILTVVFGPPLVVSEPPALPATLLPHAASPSASSAPAARPAVSLRDIGVLLLCLG
jgi:hypothetical protein